MIRRTAVDFYTTAQAAGYLGLNARTVRLYVKQGRLTPFRKVGRNYLFAQTELDRFKAIPRHGGRPKRPRDDDHGPTTPAE